MTSVLTAALSFFVGGERRTDDTEDDDPTDGPAAPRRTVGAAGDVPAGGAGACQPYARDARPGIPGRAPVWTGRASPFRRSARSAQLWETVSP
ncbi:hypothetical protein AB0L42_43200 [Streptomyces sp. NPDC052287]|uniref:hypothetical protein n=1 Tax=Streptomyces sp. NPDC052287 TaxID=3154950 RepID=UPI0034317A2C